MEVSDYIGAVASEGELFASAAERGELNVDVSTCPGWDMRELVRHLGLIHLWAAGNVAFPKDGWLEADDLTDLAGLWPDLAASWPNDADLVSWYRDTHANLIKVLESMPTDLECFTFLPAPSPLSMWARRQANEIAMHRFDAERARGETSHFDSQFATDGIDELLCGFGPRPRELDIESAKTMHVHTEDTDEHWFVTMAPERTETARAGGDADLTLTGKAADLYVLLWNRTPDSSVTMTGDTDVMDLWHGNFRVRWS
jgi:uncharacterized protein (TIGR03083 family)